MERDREDENLDQKAIDPYVALEKITRLYRKHGNYEFRDELLNALIQVRNPQVPQALPGEHLLKQYWRQAQCTYFRPITSTDFDRLDYVQRLINQHPQSDLPFRAPADFWNLLQQTVRSAHLKNHFDSEVEAVDNRNWLSTLYANYRIVDSHHPSGKKDQKQDLKKLNDVKKVLAKDMKEGKVNRYIYKEALEREQKNLKKIIPEKVSSRDQVNEQIASLQKELKSLNRVNQGLFNQMKSRVAHQVNQRKFTYCCNSQDDVQPFEPLQKPRISSELVKEIEQIDLKASYLKYIILNLEKKQVAQSISKILKAQKVRGVTQFSITFETAMNLKTKTIPEKELEELNRLREYSLLKFYNTSLKTRYSFICQNFVGFRDIFNRRNKPCKYKDRDMLQAIKSFKQQAKDPSIKGFQTFQICHHCKLLYPENYLVACRYDSTKLGAPINTFPYFDMYFNQIVKNDPHGSTTRFSLRKRNAFTNYTKKDEQHVCRRKYCRYCLRQNYQQGIDKNGLCPFCQGICFCTRCARNDVIFRLKSMFTLLGGNIHEIIAESELEKIRKSDEDSVELRKRGRPKKLKSKSLSYNPRSTEKMLNIRADLDECRVICDVVKRRQKQKEKLAKVVSDGFDKKIKLIAKDYEHSKKQSKSQPKKAVQKQQVQLDKKLQKKLHRMI